MATIEARHGKRGAHWRVKVRLAGQPEQTRTFATKREAQAWAAKQEGRVADGRDLPTAEARTRTVAEAIDRYCAEVAPELRSAADVIRQLAWWRERIGHLVLMYLSRDVLSHGRAELLKRNRTPATINRYQAALTRMLAVATSEWGWLERNPLERTRKLREPPGRVRYLTDAERERLLAAVAQSESASLRLAVPLALSTGARQGELLALRWSDVDLKRGFAYLRTSKNGERRALPLVPTVAAMLREAGRGQPAHAPVMTNFRTAWNRVVKVAELDNFRFHDLRHTTASYLAMSGATSVEIAEVLGHKSLQMVKRYAHLAPEHAARVVHRMAETRLGWGNPGTGTLENPAEKEPNPTPAEQLEPA